MYIYILVNAFSRYASTLIDTDALVSVSEKRRHTARIVLPLSRRV